MSQRALLLAVLTACHPAPTTSAAPEPLTLVIAPSGDDGADGITRPLATLEGARDAIRRLRRGTGLPPGGVSVVIRAGTYLRDQPFELGQEDSGTATAPIVYRAAEDGWVRILGGQQLGALTPVRDEAVLARLSPEARRAVRVFDLRAHGIIDTGSAGGGGIELFANGVALPLARWPDEGYVHIADVPAIQPINVRGYKGDRSGRFRYEGDRPARWIDEPDIWLHGFWFWDWSDERQRVAAIDVARHEITLAAPLHHYGYRKGQWFYAYNVLAELDRPGEWYVDRSRSILYVWPPEGSELIVSVADQLVTMQDVSFVTLSGLTFEASRSTAVTIAGGTHAAIHGGRIADIGGWAVRITGGTHHSVTGVDIEETAQGGISLDGGDRHSLAPAGHEATANHIHHYSRWNLTRQAAIEIAGVGQRVANNSIHDAPHVAIVFSGNDHVIEGNDIQHVCSETRDAGAIYAGRDWSMRGTIIRNNLLRDLGACNGVYLDDMFSGTEVTDNVFKRVTRGVFVGGGRDNVVVRNVFIDCEHPIHVDARGLGWAAYSIPTMRAALAAVPYTSPVWATHYPGLVRILLEQPAAPRGNIIHNNVAIGGGENEIEPGAKPFVGSAREP